MKAFVVFIAVLASSVAAQDVEIPGNLLDPKNSTKTVKTESIDPQPDTVRETRPRPYKPPRIDNSEFVPLCAQQSININGRLLNSLSNCDIVAPFPDSFDLVESRASEPDRVITETTDLLREEEFGQPEVDVDTVCPVGQVRSGFGCVSPHRCPEGYERQGNRCVQIEIACPRAFHREGSRCVQEILCPDNYVRRGDRCEIIRTECNAGYTWNGQQCIIDEIVCPSGYVYRQGQCIMEMIACLADEEEYEGTCRPIRLNCPPGYIWTSTGFCERQKIRCPLGFTLNEGRCIRTNQRCPPGYQWDGVMCSRIVSIPRPSPRPVPVPPERITPSVPRSDPRIGTCPPGYNFYQGQCYRCNTLTVTNTPACANYPSTPNINVNVYNTGASGSSAGKGYNIVNNIHPANNTIVNFNNITNPVTLNNVNENTIHIHHAAKCADGSIRTTVIKNNETEHSCTEAEEVPTEEIVNETSSKKCCEVVSPRQCKQRSNSAWGCGHRRYNYCGNFCASNRVYLQPQQTTYTGGVLTLMPMPFAGAGYQGGFQGYQGGSVDCSGCQDGSFNCSHQCYTYPCSRGECTFMNQADFCGTVGGNVCI